MYKGGGGGFISLTLLLPPLLLSSPIIAPPELIACASPRKKGMEYCTILLMTCVLEGSSGYVECMLGMSVNCNALCNGHIVYCRVVVGVLSVR